MAGKITDPISTTTAEPYGRARCDCIQDGFENAPFACVGGLEARGALRQPKWISDEDWPEYRRGYEEQAQQSYGDDWRTCAFGWRPALVIGGADSVSEPKEKDPRP
jgi:hypothetical protein